MIRLFIFRKYQLFLAGICFPFVGWLIRLLQFDFSGSHIGMVLGDRCCYLILFCVFLVYPFSVGYFCDRKKKIQSAALFFIPTILFRLAAYGNYHQILAALEHHIVLNTLIRILAFLTQGTLRPLYALSEWIAVKPLSFTYSFLLTVGLSGISFWIGISRTRHFVAGGDLN